jgi:hypothetical protein
MALAVQAFMWSILVAPSKFHPLSVEILGLSKHGYQPIGGIDLQALPARSRSAWNSDSSCGAEGEPDLRRRDQVGALSGSDDSERLVAETIERKSFVAKKKSANRKSGQWA